MKNRIKDNVINSFKRAESRQKHHLNEMFMDVYGGEEPWNIVCILSVSYRYWQPKHHYRRLNNEKSFRAWLKSMDKLGSLGRRSLRSSRERDPICWGTRRHPRRNEPLMESFPNHQLSCKCNVSCRIIRTRTVIHSSYCIYQRTNSILALLTIDALMQYVISYERPICCLVMTQSSNLLAKKVYRTPPILDANKSARKLPEEPVADPLCLYPCILFSAGIFRFMRLLTISSLLGTLPSGQWTCEPPSRKQEKLSWTAARSRDKSFDTLDSAFVDKTTVIEYITV